MPLQTHENEQRECWGDGSVGKVLASRQVWGPEFRSPSLTKCQTGAAAWHNPSLQEKFLKERKSPKQVGHRNSMNQETLGSVRIWPQYTRLRAIEGNAQCWPLAFSTLMHTCTHMCTHMHTSEHASAHTHASTHTWIHLCTCLFTKTNTRHSNKKESMTSVDKDEEIENLLPRGWERKMV